MSQSMTARRGFTLLELLVVLAIIGILVSLTAAAVFRLRNSRDEVVTNETLEKLQGGFDIQRKAIQDQIRKEQPYPGALALANGDPELAKVIHMKLRMRQEFPDKISELTVATLFPNISTGNAAFDTYVNTTVIPQLKAQYPPKSAYTQHLTTLSGLNASDQNAALLALIFTVSRGSANFDPETSVGSAGTGTISSTTLKFFKDRWGRAIEFRRQPDTTAETQFQSVVGELNQAPYVNTAKAKSLTHSYDALDPDARLQRNNDVRNALNQWLGQVNSGDNRQTIIFSQGAKAGINGDELYGFRLKGTGKGS